MFSCRVVFYSVFHFCRFEASWAKKFKNKEEIKKIQETIRKNKKIREREKTTKKTLKKERGKKQRGGGTENKKNTVFHGK